MVLVGEKMTLYLQRLFVDIKYFRTQMHGHTSVRPSHKSSVALLLHGAVVSKVVTPPDCVLHFQLESENYNINMIQ